MWILAVFLRSLTALLEILYKPTVKNKKNNKRRKTEKEKEEEEEDEEDPLWQDLACVSIRRVTQYHCLCLYLFTAPKYLYLFSVVACTLDLKNK